MEALASRLQDKLTVDGPEFEMIYESDGDLDLVDYARKNDLSLEDARTKMASSPEDKTIDDTIKDMMGTQTPEEGGQEET